MSISERWAHRSPRDAVLGVLGVITLGVAALSVYVSYQILDPRFGGWAMPVVGALDALWIVVQATEILAGSNRRRARRVMAAGLLLTAVNAAIPTADLILTGGFDLAVILTPVAIVATKVAWWVVLPSLGRRMSPQMRQRIDLQRQEVADRLEEMEAEAAQRIELLTVARGLERQVARAETAYRREYLKTQQRTAEQLHKQATKTASTVEKKPLPGTVPAIALPELGTWKAIAPALPVAGRHADDTQVSALPEVTGTDGGTADGTDPTQQAVPDEALADLAAVAGVPVPEPGTALTDEQLDVVLRCLRYSDDPPLSYRAARDRFRRAGFVGGEQRVRQAWAALMKLEGLDDASEDGSDTESETEDADA